jgi:sugar-specific transcriptional regulator TrmB
LEALRKRKVSQEQVLKTLMGFGLTQIDAEVYVFLAKKGAQKGLDIRNALKLTKEQLYSSLRNMKSKGIVSSTIEHPARFSALPFEKVLDLFIKTKMEETQRLQQSKEAILSNWQKLDLAETEATAKFTVIEGRSYIYTKIQQMIQEAKDRVLAITTVPSLMQADQHGILDAGFRHPLKSRVQFRFLADLSRQNVNVMKNLLKETQSAKLNVEGRNPDLGLRLFPQMFIRDEEEALFFIRPRTETSTTEQDDVCLWTDCKTLVKAFTAIFEELWCTSTDMRQKITEIETGKLTPTTFVIRDPETAKKKYIETVRSAKEEIVIITSSKGLSEFWKNIPELKEWTERGVSIKIMAPIVNENLEAAKQLSRLCAVRHISPNYLHTTMVDGKHLFQFKTPPQERQKLEPTPHFENTFYTNDLEYIEKTKPMLNDIWKNARAPSTDTLEAILGPGRLLLSFPDAPTKKGDFTIINDDPLGTLTEKDVLDKIINAKKIPHNLEGKIISRAYYSEAIAVIHPPKIFDLPDMLIHARHYEKLSTFGEGDVLMIHMWLETPKGQKYVPVAVIGDNPGTQWLWKNRYEASPAGQNVQLVSKDDLQIRVHGNTLFVGWTVPIPLYPPQRILPPACTLIEAYGDVKTAAYTVCIPFGVWGIHPKFGGSQLKFEENYFNAFVTFIHPSSKYSGPGTDGFFVRDVIFTLSPSIRNDKSGNAT